MATDNSDSREVRPAEDISQWSWPRPNANAHPDEEWAHIPPGASRTIRGSEFDEDNPALIDFRRRDVRKPGEVTPAGTSIPPGGER